MMLYNFVESSVRVFCWELIILAIVLLAVYSSDLKFTVALFLNSHSSTAGYSSRFLYLPTSSKFLHDSSRLRQHGYGIAIDNNLLIILP